MIMPGVSPDKAVAAMLVTFNTLTTAQWSNMVGFATESEHSA
jgi:hypothetical protein